MLLGGTVAGHWTTPEEWEVLLVKSRFKAVTAPFDCRTAEREISAYRRICDKHGVLIAEIGVWKNPFDPDHAAAAEAMGSSAVFFLDLYSFCMVFNGMVWGKYSRFECKKIAVLKLI